MGLTLDKYGVAPFLPKVTDTRSSCRKRNNKRGNKRNTGRKRGYNRKNNN